MQTCAFLESYSVQVTHSLLYFRRLLFLVELFWQLSQKVVNLEALRSIASCGHLAEEFRSIVWKVKYPICIFKLLNRFLVLVKCPYFWKNDLTLCINFAMVMHACVRICMQIFVCKCWIYSCTDFIFKYASRWVAIDIFVFNYLPAWNAEHLHGA